MMDLLYPLIYFLICSAVIWQLVLGIYIILIWASRNLKIHRSPVVNIGESLQKSGSPIEKVKKDLGPVEVDVKREFKVDTKPDEKSVKVDEKIKGKVKTQKDKLKKLRG